MVMATCVNPIYLEVVLGTGVIGVGPAMDFKPCVTRPELSNCAESTEALWNTLPPPVIRPGNQAKQTSPDNRTSGAVILITDKIFFIVFFSFECA